MFKKILAGILAASMALTVPVTSMAADTIDIECVLSESSVDVGDVFYADFKITDNPTGYNSMQCYINFDSSVIEALECEVADIPDDLIIYTDESGVNYSMFSYSNVNARISFVPSKGDSDYLGMADGTSTAGEIGRIKLANLLSAREDGVRLNYEGTGTLLRMKFQAIASGSSEITMTDVIGGYTDENGSNTTLSFSVEDGYVTVLGDESGSDDEETTTETTTSSSSSSSGSSSSGGSSSGGSGGSSSSGTSTDTDTADTAADTTGDEADETDSELNSAAAFSDVESDYWGASYITELASKGVVNGYPDGTFRPNDNVKRADFLIMLLRGMGVDLSAETAYESNFTDVEAGAYYAYACGKAKEMGIATGNPDGTFAPESYITRQDMMILAKKALETQLESEITGDTSVLDEFSDKDEISAYAVESLAAMVEAGIVSGMGDNIAPKANTTRAQAAVIVSKIMENIG